MYSDTNRRAAANRANDEFLRRMLGGDLAKDLPVMNAAPPPRPTLPDYSANKTACDGSPRQSPAPEASACNNCPTHLHAPSLAMVYSPRQCWKGLLDPTVGLHSGTIFSDLVLPFEAMTSPCEKGGQKPCGR